jgi:hypothetical protein
MAWVAQKLQSSFIPDKVFEIRVAEIDSRKDHLDHRAAMIEAVVESIRNEEHHRFQQEAS